MAVWPVFIVRDDLDSLMFSVSVDDHSYVDHYAKMESRDLKPDETADEGRRMYITSVVKQRLHQREFREKVIDACRKQCALCRFRHTELLDAAHIIPNGEPGGDPVVSNGLSLCKLHHAAFDNFFLAIRPDYVIEIRPDVLEEEDGLTLLHGLQNFHGKRIIVPKSLKFRPSPDRLEVRYERFLAAM